jgi:hypothetical protein
MLFRSPGVVNPSAQMIKADEGHRASVQRATEGENAERHSQQKSARQQPLRSRRNLGASLGKLYKMRRRTSTKACRRGSLLVAWSSRISISATRAARPIEPGQPAADEAADARVCIAKPECRWRKGNEPMPRRACTWSRRGGDRASERKLPAGAPGAGWYPNGG